MTAHEVLEQIRVLSSHRKRLTMWHGGRGQHYLCELDADGNVCGPPWQGAWLETRIAELLEDVNTGSIVVRERLSNRQLVSPSGERVGVGAASRVHIFILGRGRARRLSPMEVQRKFADLPHFAGEIFGYDGRRADAAFPA